MRRLLGQLANLIGNHGKSESVLTGPSGLNGSVEGKKVRLLGEIVDHLHDLADVVCARSELADDER